VKGNEVETKHYNIMTSCDEKMFSYIGIMLLELQEKVKDKTIDFYVFCKESATEYLDILAATEEQLPSISCHVIALAEEEVAQYEMLAENGGEWPVEAYFSLCAHCYLPETVERILYLDSGDILIRDDFEEFYFGDFQGKSILAASPLNFLEKGGQYFLPSAQKMDSVEDVISVVSGLFNSGSYMINLKRLREINRTMQDCYDVVFELRQIFRDTSQKAYWGDQGLMGMLYLDDVTYLHQDCLMTSIYMPYNFLLWYYKHVQEEPPYFPVIVHFIGAGAKPWQVAYSNGAEMPSRLSGDASVPQEQLLPGTGKYYEEWKEFALRWVDLVY
jgi:lipopolysaccharide biosynthesis glycosyltransferase